MVLLTFWAIQDRNIVILSSHNLLCEKFASFVCRKIATPLKFFFQPHIDCGDDGYRYNSKRYIESISRET